MPDEPRESPEDVRIDKPEPIAALGVDPWGRIFDNPRKESRTCINTCSAGGT